MGKRKTAPAPNPQGMTWIEDHVAAASLAYKDYDYTEPTDDIQLGEAWNHFRTIDSPMGLRCKVWVSTTNGNVMVSFRGTSSFKEAKIPVTMGISPFKSGDNRVIGEVYRGFGNAWEDILPLLDDNLRYLRTTNYIPAGATLQFSGHSLGGALADLAATYYGDKYKDIQVIETSIGAPTVGDANYANHARHEPNVQRTRIVAPGDPVANVKLPGMQHTEQVNVFHVENPSKKQKGVSLKDMLKTFANSVSPALGLLVDATDNAITNHSLDGYQSTLASSWRDSSIQSLDNPEVQQRREDEAYQASQESEIPVSVSDCACDCHIHDQSINDGLPPPPSLGNVPVMAPAVATPSISVGSQLPGTQSTSTDQNVAQTPTTTQLQNELQQNLELNTAVPQAISDSINAALQKAQQEDQEKLQKLQDQYAMLTNQNTGNTDPLSFNKQTIQNHIDNLNFMQNRVNMELQYPQYVPNDPDGSTTSRDMAVKFKNQMNNLYGAVMQAASRNHKNMIDPKNIEADKNTDWNVVMQQDQYLQIDAAAADGDLTPEEQPSEYVFDIRQLGDTYEDPDISQLGLWLKYPGMTPQVLFGDLQAQYKEMYSQKRLEDYRQQEQEDQATTQENLKNQIQSLSTNLSQTDQSRTAFIYSLAQNPDFQMQLESGRVNLTSILQNYQGKDSEAKLMQDLLGYDISSKDTEEARFVQQVKDLQSRNLPTEQFNKAYADLQAAHEITAKNLWMTSDQAKELVTKYSKDPIKLDEELQKLQDAHWSKPSPESEPSNPYAINVDLSKTGPYLPDAAQDIGNGHYIDEYAKEEQTIYSNPEKIKALFEEWNQGGNGEKNQLASTIVSSILNPLSAPGMVDHYLQDKNSGWFDKDGNFMGNNASPDFANYVKQHPELGYTYKGPHYNAALDGLTSVSNTLQGLVMERYTGMNMNAGDVVNMLDSATGGPNAGKQADANGDGIPDAWESNVTPSDNPLNGLNNALSQFGELGSVYANTKFWMGGGASSKNKTHTTGLRGETSPVPLKTRLFNRSRTAALL
jgi:hypothetical protein